MWFDEIFESGDFFSLYSFKEKHKSAEALGIHDMLELNEGQTVVDLCSGYGRVAFELLNILRLNVIGVDRSRQLIRIAGKRALSHPYSPAFVRGDMTLIPLKSGLADFIINIYTSFGYFEDDDVNLNVLKECFRVLKPGGKILIDLINKPWVLANMRERDWIYRDNMFILEKTEYEQKSNCWNTKKIFIDGDSIREYDHIIKAYSLSELADLMTAAGFEVNVVYGNWDMSEYSDSSIRMILIAEKK